MGTIGYRPPSPLCPLSLIKVVEPNQNKRSDQYVFDNDSFQGVRVYERDLHP